MIQLKDVPKDYLYCFGAEACPRSATCLHAMAARLLSESGETNPRIVRSVNPNLARQAATPCPFYRDNTPVRYARGMTHLFDDVPMKSGKVVRRKVMGCFSCESYFYLSRRGERLITPSEQQSIEAVFRSAGLEKGPIFDSYEDGLLW